MEPPRWIADEMLGRLARYLRFVGHDTVYVRGLDDDAIVELARQERRTLLTRDRALAARVPEALCLHSAEISAQLREVHGAFPHAPFELRFDRCTHCNGSLRAELGPIPPSDPGGVAPPQPGHERPSFRCAECGHRYWEGSHTAAIRASLGRWLAT